VNLGQEGYSETQMHMNQQCDRRVCRYIDSCFICVSPKGGPDLYPARGQTPRGGRGGEQDEHKRGACFGKWKT
jgi:hypothetical protein